MEAEKQLPEGLRPLTKRKEQRSEKAYIGTTRFVGALTPGLFIFVYVTFLALAWCRPNTPLERPVERSGSLTEEPAASGRSTPQC